MFKEELTILKKKFLAALLSCSIILSGCSLLDINLGKNDTSSEESDEDKDSSKEDVNNDESDDKGSDQNSEIGKDEQSSDDNETKGVIDLADFEANKPVFKIVQQYDRQYEYPDGQITLAGEYDLESLMLLDEYKDMYPELDSVLRQRADENRQRYNDEIEDFNSDVATRADSDTAQGKSIHNYWVKNQVIVLRSNDRYLGYYEMVQDNWTTGYLYERNGYNYDIITGQEVKLGDVLNISEDELNTILCERLRQDYPEDADELEGAEDALKDYKYDAESGDTYNWCLSYDGIHFFFNEETLVKGSLFGNHEAVISYDEDCVNDEYAYDTSKGYCYRRTDLTPDTIDRYSGGYSGLALYITPEEEGSDYASALSIAYEDQIATIDEYYDATCIKNKYDIVTPEGREYVYITIAGFDNSLELFVFEVTDNKPKACGTTWFSYAEIGYMIDPDYEGEAIPSDPSAMVFGNGSDLMGSVSYYGKYKVGDDGLPTFCGDFQTISWVCSFEGADIKTKADIDAETVDENGSVTGKTTVAAGTVVIPYRTDGDNFIDCKLEDGSIVRFTFSSTHYPVSINGVEMTELFENLCYAG